MKSISQKKVIPFKFLNWNFNLDRPEYIDVMPYLIQSWLEDLPRKKKVWLSDSDHMPLTFDEFKRFILSCCHYQYWARCQYEVIVTGWPKQKYEEKIDVYAQIRNNIDALTKHFMDFILE